MTVVTDEQAVTVAVVAKKLDVDPNTVYLYAQAWERGSRDNHAIPGFRVGRAWRFYLSAIDAHLNRQVDPWVNVKKPRGRRRVSAGPLVELPPAPSGSADHT